MNRLVKFKLLLRCLASRRWLLHAHSALACAACFGKSDSPLAQAMNWGIFSLLAVVVSVLGGDRGAFLFIWQAKPATNPAVARAGR